MEVIDPGHEYVLEGFQSGQLEHSLLFIKMENGEYLNDGTTNEEVLKVLIDRMYSLNTKFPCRENSIVITNLEESLMWLEERTRKRKVQGVEGQELPHANRN